MIIAIAGAKMAGPTNGNKKPGDDIGHDLKIRQFKPQWGPWKGTVAKLRELISLCHADSGKIDKYIAYLDFFVKLHNSCKLKFTTYTLILPPASELMGMEVNVLIDHVEEIKSAFIRGTICNLSKLPDLYKSFEANPDQNE